MTVYTLNRPKIDVETCSIDSLDFSVRPSVKVSPATLTAGHCLGVPQASAGAIRETVTVHGPLPVQPQNFNNIVSDYFHINTEVNELLASFYGFQETRA